MKRADLSPPLGYPGGPCQVVKRIRKEVRNPRLQEKLIEDVELGDDLENPEAAQIYDLDVEQGADKVVQQIRIGPHAQYRLDLRSITVPEVRAAIRNFQQKMNGWKSSKDPRYLRYLHDLDSHEGVRWEDPKLGLTVVFTTEGRGVKVITTFLTERTRVPAPGLGHCATGFRDDDELSGYKTYVEYPHPQDEAGYGRKDRLLPDPPWGRAKPFGKPEYNTPGESGSSYDGKNLSVDKARTLGKPGEDSPSPLPDGSHTITPKRRETQASGTGGPPYPVPHEKKQQGEAKQYEKRYYRENKHEIKHDAIIWHRKHKNKMLFKLDQKRREEFPKKFVRQPGGGYKEPAERTQDWRDEQAKLSAVRVADFYYKKMPPDEQGPWRDRGTEPWWVKDEQRDMPPSSGDVERGQVFPSGPGGTIPQDSSYANRRAALRVAATIADIQALCDEGLFEKAQGMPVELVRVLPSRRFWLFDVTGSKGDIYRVRIKALPQGSTLDPNKMDILISCSCPYWRWQGPEYHAMQNGYLYGKPRGTASTPDIKDPDRVHGACKHLIAALNLFSTFLVKKHRKVGSVIVLAGEDASLLDSVVERYCKAALQRSV